MPLTAASAIPTPSSLEADENALSQFIGALFRCADAASFVSWRAFGDGNQKTSVFIESSHVLDDGGASLVEPATFYATKAANYAEPVVFCPPIATFTKASRARQFMPATSPQSAPAARAPAVPSRGTPQR